MPPTGSLPFTQGGQLVRVTHMLLLVTTLVAALLEGERFKYFMHRLFMASRSPDSCHGLKTEYPKLFVLFFHDYLDGPLSVDHVMKWKLSSTVRSTTIVELQ